jgi:PPP family 3-phenylpropionic acid transporter
VPSRAPPRLAFFFAAVFFLIGVQLPFWPVWLASRGLSPVEIGAVFAVSQWVKTLTTPLLGVVADRRGERRRVMLLLGTGMFAILLLCLPARGFAPLLVLNALGGACLSALIPLGDNVALAVARAGRLDYGRMRLWGTIAFVVATLAAGTALAGYDADRILYLLIAAAGGVLAACRALPDVPLPARANVRTARRHLVAPRFLAFLAAATLIQASHSVYYAFGTLHWQTLGYSTRTIAALWAEGAVAEIALFFWGAPLLARCGALGLIALGGAGGALRWAVTALTGDLALLAGAQLLHALSFGAAHLGAMHVLAGDVPAEHSATAQTAYAAIVGGIGAGLGTLAAGALYAAAGGRAYLAMSLCAGTGAVLAALLTRRRRGTPTINS